MNTVDYIVQSDVLAGVISAILTKLSCKGVSNANMWKPAVESIVLSIIGRMFENNLTGKTFSREAEAGKPGLPYIRTEEGRSSLVIFIVSVIYAYIGKKGNVYESATLNVAADILANQVQTRLFDVDTVWYAKAK
jgi:hypothetical protein